MLITSSYSQVLVAQQLSDSVNIGALHSEPTRSRLVAYRTVYLVSIGCNATPAP
jgi:hypothetical protein